MSCFNEFQHHINSLFKEFQHDQLLFIFFFEELQQPQISLMSKVALAGNRTRASRVAGENSTTEPPMHKFPDRESNPGRVGESHES